MPDTGEDKKKMRNHVRQRVKGYRARSTPVALQDAKRESAFHSESLL